MEPPKSVSSDITPADNGEIVWVDAKSDWRQALPHASPHRRLKVLQYNILAESYAQPRWFTQVSQGNLQFSSRSKLILQQIASSAADVVCMQEVDRFASFWQPKMAEMGYDVFYAQRPQKEDGCAIFFKKHLYNLDRSKIVNYEDQFQRIAAIVSLSFKGSSSKKERDARFVVATTHLHWDDTQRHVQSNELTAFLRAVAEFNQKDGSFIILTGDLNFQPDTPMYQSIKTGLAGAVPYRFAHTYGLNQSEPEFSAFTAKHYYWIDYIWFWAPVSSVTKWGVESLVALPSRTAVSCEGGGLPNSTFGSDHLAIGAEFGQLDLTKKPSTYSAADWASYETEIGDNADN